MNITFNPDGSVEVDNLLESAEEYYSGLNSLGENMEMAHEGYLMGVAAVLGLGGARAASSAASGAGLGLFGAEYYHNNHAVNAGTIAGALDDLQHQMEISSETGNWQNPDLQSALDLVKSIYPKQNKFSGINTSADLIQLIEQAIALGSTELTAEDIANIDLAPNDQCFLEDSSVQMWPLDPSIKPRLDGSYDEELVLSKVWYKRQDQMQVGDVVVSYDKRGRLQPGDVTRTMTNTSTHILDFWGTGVTPGHAYNCADGPFKGGFAPIMDILRMDGALMRSNGTIFRSTTNCDIGSVGDRMIHAEAALQKPDGAWTPKTRGQIRFGTRISTPDGRKSISVMEIAERQGWSLSDDGYMVGKIEGKDGTVQEGKFPFPYTHGGELPKPEDYILTRSQVTLEEIYLANEWEQISTRMSAPDSLAGFDPNSTVKRSQPKPNIPPAFANRPDAPTAQDNAPRPAYRSGSSSLPPMNRKQRKAMEAKQRKALKMRNKAAV